MSVSSSAAFDSRLGEGDALDLNWERRAYDPRRAYVDSKACMLPSYHPSLNSKGVQRAAALTNLPTYYLLTHPPSKACNVLLADELQRRSGRGGGGGASGGGSALVSCSADPGPTASMLLRYALPQVSTW